MKTEIFVFCGKGGVGKTSLSSAFIRILSEKYPEKRILAVDADPAIGLSTALNIEPLMTLDDIRKKIALSIEKGDTQGAVELLNESRFHLMDAIVEKDNISFLSIGRPESAGCYCKVNAYLKEVISMIAHNYDYVVVDGEAGIEQINRRVIEKLDYIVLVSDASKKGIQVVNTIKNVSDKLVEYKKCGIVFNRVSSSFEPNEKDYCVEVLSVIGDDNHQRDNDMLGNSIFDLDKNSALFKGAKTALSKLIGD